MPGRLIAATALFKTSLAAARAGGRASPHIVILDLETDEEHELAFDAETYSLALENVYEFDSRSCASLSPR